MKVRFDLSPDADVEIEYAEDRKTPLAIVFSPLFATRNGAAVLAYGVAESDTNKILDRFSLLVSGANGKVTKKSRTGAVKATCDLSDEERKALKDENDSEGGA